LILIRAAWSSQDGQHGAMSDGALALIPAGTVFTPDDLTFWQGKDDGSRSLDQALDEADVLVSTPHAGSAMPAELAPFITPDYTRRLQFDFTDMSTGPICRRWAQLDPRIVYVENPHPRLVRDPNRPRPDDPGETLREAFARVRAAGGPGNKVDLTGVDAIRPVTFGFRPLLVEPTDDAEMQRLIAAFADAASRGLEVYEHTRLDLLKRMVDRAFARSEAGQGPQHLVTLSFHDTMNRTARPDGAVADLRAEADLLPDVVALSNRGDHNGDVRPADPVTMDPERIRVLAAAHREGFAVADPDDVLLNQPYLGSQEIRSAGEWFEQLRPETDAARITLDAVQAEFLREFLMGDAAARHIMEPGVDWPDTDEAHVDVVARACMRSWDNYRERVRSLH
jgi:hypothetical protein